MRNLIVAFLLSIVMSTSALADEWTGTWNSDYGELRLTQQEEIVFGDYADRGVIVGKLSKNKRHLTGFFVNGGRAGVVEWQINGIKGFGGWWKWQEEGARARIWAGKRSNTSQPAIKMIARGQTGLRPLTNPIDGIWKSNFGELKIASRNGLVAGFYGDRGIIFGSMKNGRIVGKFTNGDRLGNFEWAVSNGSLRGKWKYANHSSWSNQQWTATRTAAVNGNGTAVKVTSSQQELLEYKVTIKSIYIQGEHTPFLNGEPDRSNVRGELSIRASIVGPGRSEAIPSLGKKSPIVWKNSAILTANPCVAGVLLCPPPRLGKPSYIPHNIGASRRFLIPRSALDDPDKKIKFLIGASLHAVPPVVGLLEHSYGYQKAEIYLGDLIARHGENHRPYERTIQPANWNGDKEAKRSYVQYRIERVR